MKQTFIHKSLELEVSMPNQVIEKNFFSDKDDHEVVGIWLDYDKNQPNGDGTLGFFVADTEILPYDFPAIFINRGILNLDLEQVKHSFRESARGAQLYFLYRDLTVLIPPTVFKPYKVLINVVFARYNDVTAIPSLPEFRTRYFPVKVLRENSITMLISKFKSEYSKLVGVTAAAFNGGATITQGQGQSLLKPVYPQVVGDTLQIKISGQELFPAEYPVELFTISTQKGIVYACQELNMPISNDGIELMYQCVRSIYDQPLLPVTPYGIYLLFTCTEKR